MDAPLQRLAHAAVERAHAQVERGGLWNDIVGLTGMEGADGDHRHLQRVDVARHDALQTHDEGGAGDHRIGRPVRHGAVPADPFEGDANVVRRGHGRAVAQHEPALGLAGHVVHGEDGVAGEALEQAVVHHAPGAAQAFFGRLEDEVERAAEAARFGQLARGGEQHGGVAIVAAGVHQARTLAGMGQAGFFLDRQGVHVGPQPDRARPVAAAKAADHAGATEAARDLVSPGRQALGHQIAGAEFLESQFRVAVDGVAQGHEFLDLVNDGVHAGFLHQGRLAEATGGGETGAGPGRSLRRMLGTGFECVQCILC